MKPCTARGRGAAVAGLAVTTLTAAAIAGASAPDAQERAPGLRPAGAAADDVTLVTGDRVHVAPAGGKQAITVTAAKGPRPRFWVRQRGDDVYVIPEDVATLVPDRLDPALFNVTRLAEQGYANRPLPLIVAYERGAPAAPPGTTKTRELESIRAVAVDAPPARAEVLGRAMEQLANRRSGPDALAGVEKIWLDERVEAELDESVPQIGAPAAWDAGFDGAGVSVAVLDTGVDAGHPDLAGAVTSSRNFTEDPDPADLLGHGTHVASIIASRDARLRGVAPGAEVVSGKVLDRDGFGYASWVIDGMEWAAAEQRADVVNMSLGFPSDTFEGGPVAEAVERLSATSGALFVVAAGNAGCDRCIGSPGIAERALTVGAVDDDDVLAEFSSHGPVGDSYLIKPDLTAPGVGIAAAQAAGTSLGDPVDATHMRLSGTSMAAPHVAGAAALLLDARPGSTGEQVKAALMSTATPAEGTSVFAQGAGRVDVARAVGGQVVAETGSIGFGAFAFPHDGRDPVVRSVTYRNRGSAPATLQLEVAAADEAGAPVLAGGLTTGAASVTVPPDGTAAVDVVLHTALPAAGRYTGSLLARTAGGQTLRTLLSFALEEEKFDLKVKGIGRDGRTTFGGFDVVDVEDSTRLSAQRFTPGEAGPCTGDEWGSAPCVRVPRGTYSVMGVMFTMPAHAPSGEQQRTALNSALVGTPEIAVTRDTEIELDARRAREVTVETPEPDARANLGGALELVYHREPERGPALNQGILQGPGSQLEEKFFVQPTEPVEHGSFASYTRMRLEEPAIDLDVVDQPRVPLEPYYYDPVWHSDNSWQYPQFEGRRTLRLVDAGTGTAKELAGLRLGNAIALVRRSDAISVPDQAANAAAAGAELLVVYNDRPGLNGEPGETGVRLALPAVRLSGTEGAALLRRLDRGPVSVRATGVPASPYRYDLVLVDEDRIPSDPHHVFRTSDLARVDMHYHRQLDAPMTFSETSYAFQPWQDASWSQLLPLLGAPRVKREYLSTPPGTRWMHAISTPEEPYNHIWPQPEEQTVRLANSELREYAPGERREVSWLEGPIGPGLDPRQPLQRAGGLMRVAMAGLVDAEGNHGAAWTGGIEDGLKTGFKMFEDGGLIAETESLASGTLDVANRPAEYRIEYDVDNHTPWARLSTDTRGVWTFASAPDGDAIVTPPIVTLDWDVALDLDNRLKSDGAHELSVRVGHQPGAPQIAIDRLELEVSYDDGTTWRRPEALRREDGARWVAELRPPRAARFVSLRARAADAEGNSVFQRIVRAYGVKR